MKCLYGEEVDWKLNWHWSTSFFNNSWYGFQYILQFQFSIETWHFGLLWMLCASKKAKWLKSSVVVVNFTVSCARYRLLLFILLRLPACNTCKYNLNLLYTRNKIAQPKVNKLAFFAKCVNSVVITIHQLSGVVGQLFKSFQCFVSLGTWPHFQILVH